MKPINFIKYLSVFLVAVCLLSNCENCPSELQVEPMSTLPEGLDTIIQHFDKQSLIFIDADNNEFQFDLIDAFEGFEKHYIDNEAFCTDGGNFRPFKIREKKSRTYVSAQNDSITISLLSHTLRLYRQEADIDISGTPIVGFGFFKVGLSFAECEPFVGGRFTEFGNGDSKIIYSRFPFQKHGQIHTGIFGIDAARWVNDIHFSLTQGIIAFNFCGRDWVQIKD